MKAFVPALALATAVAAEADPQFLAVQTSPLLKTIVPQPAVKLIKPSVATTTYTQQVAAPLVSGTPLVYNTPAVVAHPQVQYIQQAEVKYEQAKPVEAEKKVQVQAYNTYLPATQQQVTYTNTPLTYAQPIATQPITYAAQPLHYAQAAIPAQRVYQAKNGAVEHTVINKREAEAEPFDYAVYQTGPTSFKSVPTLQKTLRPYNKAPVAAPIQQVYANQYVAPQVYANQYQYPTVYNQYAAQYPTVAVNTPYQYVF